MNKMNKILMIKIQLNQYIVRLFISYNGTLYNNMRLELYFVLSNWIHHDEIFGRTKNLQRAANSSR